MSENLLELMLKSAKAECKITWSDDDTDTRLKEMIADSVILIKSKIGMSEDGDETIFTQPSKERTLWKNLILYMWNDMLSVFDKNYRSEIQQIRRKYEVEHERTKSGGIV